MASYYVTDGSNGMTLGVFEALTPYMAKTKAAREWTVSEDLLQSEKMPVTKRRSTM